MRTNENIYMKNTFDRVEGNGNMAMVTWQW